MVKSPKVRHSKGISEPVTIELGAGEVSRIEPESTGDEKAGTKSEAATESTRTGKDAAAGGPGEGKGAQRESSASKPGQSGPEKPAQAATAGSTGQFGRPGPDKPAPATPRRDEPPPSQDAPRRRGAGSVIAAGIVGAVVALAGAGGAAWYAGLLPPVASPQAADDGRLEALRAELQSLKANIDELRNAPPASAGEEVSALVEDANARIDSLGTLVEDLRGQIAQLKDAAPAGGAAPDSAALEELRTGLQALEERVASLPASGGGDTEALKSEIARVEEAARNAADIATSAADAASQAGARLDSIEESLAALSAKVEEQGETPAVALAIAASALKSAIDRGQPFTTELDTYASLAPDSPEIAALRELAASGVPTRAEIAREMSEAANRMAAAGRPADPSAGFFDRLWNSAQSLVQVRPVGEVEGTSVPAIVARIEAAVNAGDYARALAEYETLPEEPKAAGADFMARVRARQTADQLVDKALAAALKA